MTFGEIIGALLDARLVTEHDKKEAIKMLLDACQTKETVAAVAKMVTEADEYEKAPIT